MSINVSWYDVTQLDWASDGVDDGAIPQSGANIWKALALAYQRALFQVVENRIEHRGNLQTLSIDQRVKKALAIQLEYIALKHDAGSPAYGWWDLISQAFYGGATGSPSLRPSTAWIAAKINRATPEFWLASGVKIEELVLRGNMTEGPLTVALRMIGRGFRLDTNNYVQGTATRRADPPKTPIVPSNDVTIKVDNIDVTNLVQEFTLTLGRAYERRGRSSTVAGSSAQIALDGLNYREFIPSTFDGRLELTLDPFGTTTKELIDYLNDTALATCELRAENTTNGKNIQFTASKIKGADQEHRESQSPSTIALRVDGSTFNVATI